MKSSDLVRWLDLGMNALRVPRAVFFKCYKCSEPTMSVTVFGVYCQGCGLRAFTDHTEERIEGECSNKHPEMVQARSGSTRCLVCSMGKEYTQ